MENSASVMQKVNAHVMHTYTRFDVAIASGHGATATGVDGRTYIDFGSGIGVNAMGYADPGWVAAVSAQAAKVAHISNLYYSPVQANLAELLCRVTGFDRVFFANSGAEANECLIKLARKYSFDRYGKGRSTIVTLQNSFHGRTVTTLSATGQEAFHDYFFPFTDGFRFTPPNDSAAMEAALADDVCAVLLEAVQGEGGVYPLDPDFVAKTAALAKKKDILLLFDEVQTGIGRTGTFFAFEQYGVEPDAVSSAKAIAGGLPMGAALCAKKLAGVLTPGTHASTFGGTPLVCAAALEVVGRVSQPEFLAAVRRKGAYIRHKLAGMAGIVHVRGMGLMLGMDTPGLRAGAVAARAAREGLLLLTAKDSLRMLPPLVITTGEIDRGLAILGKVLAEEKAEGASFQ